MIFLLFVNMIRGISVNVILNDKIIWLIISVFVGFMLNLIIKSGGIIVMNWWRYKGILCLINFCMMIFSDIVLIEEFESFEDNNLILNVIVVKGLIKCLNCVKVMFKFCMFSLFLKNRVVVIISMFVLIVLVIIIVIIILINLKWKIVFFFDFVVFIMWCCVRVECK